MITFDTSLPIFSAIVEREFGRTMLMAGSFVRNVLGKLTFVAPPNLTGDFSKARNNAAAELGPYVDPSSCIVSEEEINFAELRDQIRPVAVRVASGILLINLVEQRLVGQDWAAKPAPGWRQPQPARLVFWSLKGGVGRSTALCVAAVHLARAGRNVVVIDLDLESPGLSSLLLKKGELSKYGCLDWYVENGLRPLGDDFLADCTASSALGGDGHLDVVPAIGHLSEANPENVIPKLGRAYVEDVSSSGYTETFLMQTGKLVDRLTASSHYDVVMVDARAGLNESTAASLLGLGADVLMFGINNQQTFEGYRFLLGYLRGLATPMDDDWRLRLKLVHGKADLSELGIFRDRSFSMFSEFLYDEGGLEQKDSFSFDLDDPDAPHYPWVILDDSRYRHFDPLSDQNQLSGRVYSATFGDFIEKLTERVNSG